MSKYDMGIEQIEEVFSIEDVEAGRATVAEVARRHGVSSATVYRWLAGPSHRARCATAASGPRRPGGATSNGKGSRRKPDSEGVTS